MSSSNLYAFVGNDPVNAWDVLGLAETIDKMDPYLVNGIPVTTPGIRDLIRGYAEDMRRRDAPVVILNAKQNFDGNPLMAEILVSLRNIAPKKTPDKPKDDCVGLKDPKTGEITPVYDDQGRGMAFPQNADVAANVKTADENTPWYHNTYQDGQWFASMVGYGKP